MGRRSDLFASMRGLVDEMVAAHMVQIDAVITKYLLYRQIFKFVRLGSGRRYLWGFAAQCLR